MLNKIVSLEIATILYTKGYNEPCRYMYENNSEKVKLTHYVTLKNSDALENQITCPETTHLLHWLWIKHKIYIYVPMQGDSFKQTFIARIVKDNNPNNLTVLEPTNRPNEAYEQAILHVLKVILADTKF
jgi:hypothetical protein